MVCFLPGATITVWALHSMGITNPGLWTMLLWGVPGVVLSEFHARLPCPRCSRRFYKRRARGVTGSKCQHCGLPFNAEGP